MKEYALYDVKDYEQLVYMGTIREISEYLNCYIGSLRSYLTRKKRGEQKLLQRRYELIEIMETEEQNIEKPKKSNKELWREIIKAFTENKPQFEIFDHFNYEIKGLMNKVMKREETWIQIPQFEYSISNYARIRNDKNGKIKEARRKNYMLVVDLYKEGKRYTINVVRLEATLFIRPLLKNERVRHIDGDSRNNFINNLEIVSK